MAVGAVAESALLLFALGLGWLTGLPAFASLRFDPADLAAGLAATLPLLAALAWCLRTRWRPIAELMRVVDEQVAPLFRGRGIGGLALLALLAGVAEEALFRGVLQPWLAGWLPQWAALLLASGVFGALHWITGTYALLAALAGAWFGLLVLLTGNLLPPIVAHATYDLVALVILSRPNPRPGDPVLDQAAWTSPRGRPDDRNTSPEDPMTVTATHAPGTFCWADLGTTDSAAAKRFYTGLFGWSFEDRPMGNDRYYTMLELRGKPVAALYPQQEDERSAGIPPHWLCYIAVESADKAASRASERGGTVLAPPFDVFDAGRMAIIRDPEGAVVALWEARGHPGAGVLGEPGAMCWHELLTRDTARAGEFYSGLLGWTRESTSMERFTYTMFKRGEQMAGGMMPILPEWGDMPPNWGVYFAVADVDATAARAEELGGKILSPAADIPGIGRFAVIQDPQGAVFSLFRPLHP